MLITMGLQTHLFAAPNEGIQLYKQNVKLSAEHKQKLAAAISRYHSADNLWDVLRDEFSLQHYDYHPAVQEKIDWFMNNQDYLMRSAARAAPYLYYILQQVRKRHLPAEIVLLPIIESGYNPFSLSSVGAAGIWQLMPNTATGLGVKQDIWYDGRRDIIASTRGALSYLVYLQNFFEGNWLLAFAAYNTGEGNVLSAIKKNIRYGIDTDFWSLPVAQQTKDYVPSLLALAVIISHPEQYPVYFPTVKNAPYLAQVEVGKHITLKHAASLAGISYEKLMILNPGFNRPATRKSYKLVLPIENIEQFAENVALSPVHKINWIHYKVKRGDKLLTVAKRFKTTVAAIRKLNHLSKPELQNGMNLLIPHTEPPPKVLASKPAHKKAHTPLIKKLAQLKSIPTNHYQLQPGDTVYVVRKKDHLKRIAQHFRVTTHAIKLANQLKNDRVRVGKQLIIPTHHFENILQPGDTIYMVRRGDTIRKIANKFRTTEAAVRLANLIDDTTLREGEKLIVPTHMRG